MRAVVFKSFGGPEVLSLATNVLIPQLISSHDVIIKVIASAVNRGDIMQRKGYYPPPLNASDILGLEACGIVDKIGSDVKNVKVGDKVIALLSGGGYAEYCSVNAGTVMHLPKGLSFEEGAAIPEVFLTSWQCLRRNMDIKSGERVLLHAGASGIGTAAAQLAKKVLDATVITTSSDKKVSECKKFADYCFSRTTDPETNTSFESKLMSAFSNKPQINACIDPVFGNNYLRETINCCAIDARITILAMMGGSKLKEFSAAKAFAKRINLQFFTLRSRSDEYKSALVESFVNEALPFFTKNDKDNKIPRDKRLVPVIHSVMPLEEVMRAHLEVENNSTTGKVILKIGE